MTTDSAIESPTTPRYCPFCGMATTGSRFCAGCGHDALVDLPALPDAPFSLPVPPRPIVWAGPVLVVAGVLAIFGTLQSWLTIPPYVSFLGSAEDGMTWNGIDFVRPGWSVDIGAQGALTIAVGLLIVRFGIALLYRRGRSLAIRIGTLACVPVLAWVVQSGISRVVSWNTVLPGYEERPPAVVGMGMTTIAWAAALTLVGALIPTWRGRSRRDRSRGP